MPQQITKSIIENIREPLETVQSDSATIDAFGRIRVSNPETLFDSKQIHDNSPLFWDEALISGSGITSVWSANLASTVLASTLNTAGNFVRQTFMRFNYQPGKSQLTLMTGVFNYSGGGTGVERSIGVFDDNNGLFFKFTNGIMSTVMRSNVTGTPVDTATTQANWNIDKLDGSGASSITVDWSAAQIIAIDYEWLGVGRVRYGLVIDGLFYYVHEELNANKINTVYMSTPNLPLRYEITTTASSPVSEIQCICASVVSEGGSDDLGVLRYRSTAGVTVSATTAGTLYAILGIRFKTTHLATTIKLINITIANQANDNFEWFLIMNPTVAGTFVYSDETNSSLQSALGSGAPGPTVTGGIQITGGIVKSSNNSGFVSVALENALRLGSAIDGTRDTFVICVRPRTNGANIDAGLTWRELS